LANSFLTSFSAAIGVASLALAPHSALASGMKPSAAESFPVGTSGSACEAQGVSMGDTRRSIFDRKWVILCSDVVLPVGTAYALRDASDAPSRIAAAREEALDCGEGESERFDAGGLTRVSACREVQTGLEWRRYSAERAGTYFSVEGLAGFDSALKLALSSLIADSVVEGEVSIANLGAQDSLAIFRAKAAVLDTQTLLGQGYRDNNAGSYAQAAELFAAAPALFDGDEGTDGQIGQLHELKINQALQLSNLGAFDQAARLFMEAGNLAGDDPVQMRLARNYEAIDAVNRDDLDGAIAILDRPVTAQMPGVAGQDGAVRIDSYTAASLNAPSADASSSVLGQETRLTPQERAMIIDAQALQLRGIILRMQGKTDAARVSLGEAYNDSMRVRDGRVTSIARLRSQTLSEIAQTYEAQGNFTTAEALLRRALAIVESQYPDSTSVNSAKARLAGFLARRGERKEALGLYRTVATSISDRRNTLSGIENVMRPYFDLLTDDVGQASPDSVAELFLASQLVERPGAADTLTQLSRQLEQSDNEASSLYRQSLGLARQIERNRVRIARLDAGAEAGAGLQELEALQQGQAQLLESQRAIINTLSDYPAFRAVAQRVVSLEDLQASLRPGEAYLKLARLSGSTYAVFISPGGAKGWRIGASAREITDLVAVLRDSISVTVNGVQSTYPFDIDAAVELHEALLGPIASEIASIDHLIFEPDGAMLQLPLNLLSGDRKGVAAYHGRVEAGGDEYDFTGIDWLGRETAISTALSASSFRNARAAPSSTATQAYLGFGHNLPLGNVASTPRLRNTFGDAGCSWPVAAWNQPISAGELRDAGAVFSASQSEIVTGAAFNDTDITHRQDLDRFRILHFATHGLVTPPNEGCPVRPALLTSFGREDSDGLLSFTEIFDLRLNADLVVLSACDTAGQASLVATREAGVTSGGGQALDGLVRAFIAAGGRQVIASHWPAPDDYNATRRLFTSFYRSGEASIGDALKAAQRELMDDPDTSHPFYWAGFAVVGDAGRPVTGR